MDLVARCWTVALMGVSLVISEGCVVAGEDDSRADAELEAEVLLEGVMPSADDEAICEVLAEREHSCRGGFLADGGCPARFACSRQLWRAEVVEDVYACVRSQPCDVADPAMTCLTEVGGGVEPTEIQREAEEGLRALEGHCDGMLAVAPGQIDEVYEIVRDCLGAESTCEGIATCVTLSLDALVDDVCYAVETI